VTDLAAAQSTAGEIFASWTAPINDGGSAITDYDVEYSPSPYSSWTNTGAVEDVPEATITGLTAGVTYKVRVAAVNAIGSSTFVESDPILMADVPDPPTGLTVLPQAGGRLAVYWTAPVDDGGAPITDYLVEWGVSPAFTASTNVPAIVPTYVIPGLLDATTYAVRVSAYNLAGASTVTSTVTGTTQAFPFLEDFYEWDAEPWDTNAWPLTALGAGSALDVEGEMGRMVAGTGNAVYVNAGSYPLVQDDIDFRFDWTVSGIAKLRALFRASSTLGGYSLLLDANADTATLHKRTSGFVDSALTSGTQTAGFTIDATDVVHVRIRAEGSTHKVRVWKNADPEPSTWLLDAVDATHSGSTQRRVGFHWENIGAGAVTAHVDDIVVEAPPVVTATVVPSSFFFAA
jgi:hypothetical protein